MNEKSWSIDRSSPVPLYYQLACSLRDKIRGGALVPGMRLPTEHELAGQAGMSRLTARQSYTLLERDGLIQRCPSKGTYVAHHQQIMPIASRKNVLFVTFIKELDAYFRRVLQGIEKGLNAGGGNLMVRLAADNELDTMRNIIQTRPDGVLWTFWDFDKAPALIREVQSAGLPLVLIDACIDHMRADYVGIDLTWGIEKLVHKIAGRKCRRIRFLNVGHHRDCRMMQKQESAFQNAIIDSGLKPAAGQVEHKELSMADALNINPILDKLARQSARYDALILNTSFADPLDYARYLWRHYGAALRGKKVGFMLSDAHPAVSVEGLPLISVRRTDYEVGRKAADLMLKRLRGQGPRGPQTILVRSV